jgi:hypothetical protein
MYGDKKLEEQFLIALRQAYTYPLWCETPVHLLKNGAERIFADQADREVELAALNQHPHQLFIYEVNNKRIQQEVEDEAVRASGEKTLDDQMFAYLELRVKEEKKKMGDARLSFERFAEIYADCLRRLRAETSRPTLDKNGNYQDFLEVRRPFIAPNNESATN